MCCPAIPSAAAELRGWLCSGSVAQKEQHALYFEDAKGTAFAVNLRDDKKSLLVELKHVAAKAKSPIVSKTRLSIGVWLCWLSCC